MARYARRERIADHSLNEAIGRAGRGMIDADLGGGIIKQRVARSGQGRSGVTACWSPTEPARALCSSMRSPRTSAKTSPPTNY
jgi:hypothetical protein